MVDDNKKLPKDGVSEQDIEPKYGFITGEWRECGGSRWHYEYKEEKDKTYSQKTHPSGAYDTIENNDKKKEINTSLRSGEVRHYVAGGKSTHVDGHHDINVESTQRTEVAGDIGQAGGKNYYRGTKNKEVKISGDTAKIKTGSEAVSSRGYSGTVRNSYDKDYFNHVQGDIVSMGEKNKATVVKEDYAINAGQNMDTYIKQKGKIETGSTMFIQTGSTATINSASDVQVNAASEVMINASSKITLKVGSSKIEISSGSITITSPSIEFKQG
jgi:hypothetical protein